MDNKCRCFNQKKYEQLLNLIKEKRMYMYSLDFYDFMLFQRERFKFLNPDKYYKINKGKIK